MESRARSLSPFLLAGISLSGAFAGFLVGRRSSMQRSRRMLPMVLPSPDRYDVS